MKKYDISRAAEGLTAYAIEWQSSFERHQPRGKSSWAESRRFWTDAILQGMARLKGGTPDPEKMARFDQRLAAAHGCAAVEMTPPSAQKELIQNLRNYVSALEATGEHRGLQVAVVRELLEDMATHPSWDSSANGLDHARDEVDGILLRMTARKPIHFTRILLGSLFKRMEDLCLAGYNTNIMARYSLLRQRISRGRYPALCSTSPTMM